MTTKSQRDLWLLLAQVRSSSRKWSCSSEICCLEQVVCWSWRLSKRLSLAEAHLCMFSQAPSFQTTQNICIRVYQHLLIKRKLFKNSQLIQAMKLESTLNQKLVTLAPQKTINSNGWTKVKTKFWSKAVKFLKTSKYSSKRAILSLQGALSSDLKNKDTRDKLLSCSHQSLLSKKFRPMFLSKIATGKSRKKRSFSSTIRCCTSLLLIAAAPCKGRECSAQLKLWNSSWRVCQLKAISRLSVLEDTASTWKLKVWLSLKMSQSSQMKLSGLLTSLERTWEALKSLSHLS